MASVRKDTLTSCGEYARHLRPFMKKKVAKAELRAARRLTMTEDQRRDEKNGLYGAYIDIAN